jgi:hypothetical protein
MAKIAPPPAPKSRKGAPPPMVKTVGNLDKPESASLQTLNLRVPLEFKRELKVYAAQQGRSMTELLMEAFGMLRESRG